MTGFEISDAGRSLIDQFPTSELLRRILPRLGEDEILLFLRQWVAEGIPFAFRECPLVYERLRSWMGRRLHVEPRNITVIGSARLGCSLAPEPDFGRRFYHGSDLDFQIISDSLFASIVAEFFVWQSKVNTGEEQFVGKYTKRSLKCLPANIEHGFIDAFKMDQRPYLKHVIKVTNTEDYGHDRLKATDCGPTFTKLHIRVHASFNAFFQQMKLNLITAISSL